MTREFPEPGDRQTTIDDPRYPQGALKLCVPERERRQNHISQIDPNLRLLIIALDCLKDKDIERPSAQQLCERVAALKGTSKYKRACKRAKDYNGKDRPHEQRQVKLKEKKHIMHMDQQDASRKDTLHNQLEEKDRIIDQKDATIAEREEQLRQCREELTQQIEQLERDKQQLENRRCRAFLQIAVMDRQLGRVNRRLEQSEQVITDLAKRNTALEEVLRNHAKLDVRPGIHNIELRWREKKRAPCEMGDYCDAVVDNWRGIVYCMNEDYFMGTMIHAYYIHDSSWGLILDCPANMAYAIAVIYGMLTTIGGYISYYKGVTNKLFSLTSLGANKRVFGTLFGREGQWTEAFPPMPTKRVAAGVLCTGTFLVVAGGFENDKELAPPLKVIEVLNIKTRQWHTAPDLPQPLRHLSLTLCGDDVVYMLGRLSGNDDDGACTTFAYTCSLRLLSGSQSLGERLISILTQSSAWCRVADLPIKYSTIVTLHGHLLAIGGSDSSSSFRPTTAVHIYHPDTNSWEIISRMTTARSSCIAAVLPDNQLMVVGGVNVDRTECDSVEFGICIH